MRPDELEALLTGLVESTPEAALVVDDQSRIVAANEAAGRVFGFARAELVGSELERLVPERLRAQHRKDVDAFLERPRERRMGAGVSLSGLRKDGREFPAQISLHPVETDAGTFIAATVIAESDGWGAQEASAWLTAIVQSTGDAIVGLAPDGTVASWNAAAERLYGYSAEEVLGRPDEILVPPEQRREHQETLARALTGEIVAGMETEALRKDGSKLPVASTASPIHDASRQVIGVARIVRDITDRRRVEHELKFFADHDPLTGLFNRRRFGDELERHVAQGKRYPEAAGGVVLMADLDHFKYVNDTLGHRAGDELIKAVAHLLHSRLRDTDVVGRLSGDEFAVLLPRASLDEAAGVAESLRKAIHDFEMALEGHSLRTTVSIGIAPVDPQLTPADLVATADLAMYRAKGAGRDRVAMARSAEQGEIGVYRQRGWAQRLRAALSENRFELFAQPIVEIVGHGNAPRYELLLRLREDGELIPPGAFIYAAERFGLVGEIDRQVITRAIRLLAADPEGRIHYHVNLSGVSITDPGLLEFLRGSLASAGVDPARLTFEVTETAAIADMDGARGFAAGLHEIGCALALDDFGSGFGSFSYLRYVPAEFLKIDGNFVSGMEDSGNDRLLVKTIVDVAHGMRMRAIAEHVGSDKARALLAEYGADFGQGYHLGEPAPLSPAAAG